MNFYLLNLIFFIRGSEEKDIQETTSDSAVLKELENTLTAVQTATQEISQIEKIEPQQQQQSLYPSFFKFF